MDIFHFVDHGLVDLAEVKIDGRAQHAQVANNSGLGVLLQLLIYLIFNSSMGGDEMTFFHASQIGNTGNNSAGVLLVLCSAATCRSRRYVSGSRRISMMSFLIFS